MSWKDLFQMNFGTAGIASVPLQINWLSGVRQRSKPCPGAGQVDRKNRHRSQITLFGTEHILPLRIVA
jgi:hypothetical protein